MELLSIYHDEWKFRQEGLWKRIIQFFVVIFFTSTLPITIRVFSGPTIPDIPLEFFPYLGMGLTLFFLWFCLSESIRINSVNNKIITIMKDLFPAAYVKTDLIPLTKRKETIFIFKWRMAIWVPIVLSIMEVAVSVFMLYLIFNSKLQ